MMVQWVQFGSLGSRVSFLGELMYFRLDIPELASSECVCRQGVLYCIPGHCESRFVALLLLKSRTSVVGNRGETNMQVWSFKGVTLGPCTEERWWVLPQSSRALPDPLIVRNTTISWTRDSGATESALRLRLGCHLWRSSKLSSVPRSP